MGRIPVLERLFRPRQARIAGEALYAGLVNQARRPALYRDLGVADRIDSRFELYVLHLALLLTRLKGEGEAAFAEYDGLIADIKARHADKLASKTLVSVQPGEGVLYVMNGTKMLQPQVLADLGAKTIPPAEGQDYDAGETPAEAFGDTLGQVDGLILATTSPEGAALLDGEPTWQRLPAVTSGALVASNGNINYGSIFSAIKVAQMVVVLFGKMA